MAEPNDTQKEPTEPTNEPQPEPQGQQTEPHGTDWKAEARKWEERAKANKAKADKWDEQEEANKSELDKAREAAQAAQAELDALKKAKAHSDLVGKVSAETGIPAHLLHGDTEEELSESAKQLASFIEASKPTFPTDKGGSTSNGAAVTRETIMAIKNPTERVRAIAANKELFQ